MNPPNDRSSRRKARREQRRREEQQPPQYPAPPFEQNLPPQGMPPQQSAAPQQGWYADQGGNGPHAGYQYMGPGQSASTAYSRPPQTIAVPQAQGPAMRSAPGAVSAPDPQGPGIIGSHVAAKIEEEPRSFLRVTIMFEDRRGDLLLPGNVPLAELLPSLVKKFTSMTPRSVTRGYVLIGIDGRTLDPGKTLFDLHISDGTVLSLASRVKEREKKYDDIVEAVADAAAEMNKPWTPAHTANTAVGAAAVLVLVSLLMMFQMRGDVGTAVPIMTGTLTLLHMGLAWVLQRTGRSWHAVTIALLASAAAGVTGLSIIEAPLTELPAVFGGLAMMLVSGATIVLLKQWRELLMVPMLVGAVIAIIGGLYIAFDFEISSVAVTIAGLTGVAILTVPQAALRMSGLDRDREKVEAKETRKLYTRGHRMMVGFWVSSALILLIVALPTVEIGAYGVAVMALCTMLLAMSTRRSFARIDVLLQYVGALAVFIATSAAVIMHHPQGWPFVIVAMLLVIIATAAFGLVMGRTWTWMRRAADIAEIFAIIFLIPATVLALKLW